MGDDTQKVRYSPTATVRAFRASQAMGRAQRDAGGEIPVELLWGIPQAKQPFVLLPNRKKQSFERKL